MSEPHTWPQRGIFSVDMMWSSNCDQYFHISFRIVYARRARIARERTGTPAFGPGRAPMLRDGAVAMQAGVPGKSMYSLTASPHAYRLIYQLCAGAQGGLHRGFSNDKSMIIKYIVSCVQPNIIVFAVITFSLPLRYINYTASRASSH